MPAFPLVDLPVEEMGNLNGALPVDALAFKVRLSVDRADQIMIEYTKAASFQIDPALGIAHYLKEIAADPANVHWRGVKEPEPHKSNSTLSVRHNGFSYLIFVLEQQNWQYAVKIPPFLVLQGKKDYYTNALCAWSDIEEPAKVPPDYAQAMVACFIANSAADPESHTGSDFAIPFNIYVNLRLPGVDAAGNRVTKLLPIVFDPDVGYPGGHT